MTSESTTQTNPFAHWPAVKPVWHVWPRPGNPPADPAVDPDPPAAAVGGAALLEEEVPVENPEGTEPVEPGALEKPEGTEPVPPAPGEEKPEGTLPGCEKTEGIEPGEEKPEGTLPVLPLEENPEGMLPPEKSEGVEEAAKLEGAVAKEEA